LSFAQQKPASWSEDIQVEFKRQFFWKNQCDKFFSGNSVWPVLLFSDLPTLKFLNRKQGDQIGQIFPIGLLLALGSFLFTELAQIVGQLFSTAKVMHQFWPKNGLGYILGHFSQTHLVTLIGKRTAPPFFFFASFQNCFKTRSLNFNEFLDWTWFEIEFGTCWARSLIRNEKPIVLFERHCHATEKSEAIACARSCGSSRLTRWWTRKE
jgi:hypothetical protein